MSTIQANAQNLQSWLKTSGGGQSAGTASKATIEQASAQLNIPVADLHAARRFLVEQAAQNIDAGRGPAALTGRGQAGQAGFGGTRVEQSAGVVGRQNAGDPKIVAFEKSDYTLLDAKKVMEKRGLGDIDAAKKFIGEKIIGNKEAELHAMGVNPDNFDSYELRDAFARSPYTEADAKAALKQFGFLSNLTDAKEYIGLKIVNGPAMEAEILGAVGITRNNFDNHDCYAAFKTSGYSSADVKAAKKEFDFLRGCSDREVQEYIGLKIVNGYESMLAEKGITPEVFDSQDLMAAFQKSTYSSSDVDAAREKFDFLHGASDKDVKEYIGLKIVNGYEQMLSEVGISPQRWDDHELVKAFAKSGYDDADVNMARDKFDFLAGKSDIAVQRYIGLKIVNKYESMLSEVGITPRGAPTDEIPIESQQGMNRAAYQALEKATGKMNDAGKALREQLDQPSRAELSTSMKAFEQYIAAEGTFAGNFEARGGSLAPLVNAGSQRPLVLQFTSELNRAARTGWFEYQGTSTVNDAPQQEMNRAAYEAFQGADDKMKSLVAKLEAKLATYDPESVKELRATQQAFETFREAQGELAGNMEARGGSLAPLIKACSLEALTRQRIGLLEQHLKGMGDS